MRRIVVAVSLLFVCAACSHTPPAPYSSLRGRTILPLSNKNPYLGTNLFLAQERRRDSTLAQFVSLKGGPGALSITEDGNAVTLYYPSEHQVFLAVREPRETTYNGEWIVQGPFKMARKDFIQLRGSQRFWSGEPALLGTARPRNESPEYASLVSHETVIAPRIKEKKVVKKKTPTVTHGHEEPSTATVTTSSHPEVTARQEGASVTTTQPSTTAISSTPPKGPLNSDQRAYYLSQGFADRDSQGNGLHTVKVGQTLQDIAKWYCNDEKAAEELAKYNALVLTDPLKEGTVIKIPDTLLKNQKTLQ